ncbi:MAG: CBS domain-containing protein [Planctomycetota bacterium]
MQIRKLMKTDVVTLQADEPLIDAVEAAASVRIRHLPVLEGEELVGILSVTDIKHATPSPLVDDSAEQYRKLLQDTPVRRIMRRAPLTVSPEASLADVVRLMLEHKIGAVPILEEGKLVGIVSELDVLRSYLQVLEVFE